MVGCTTPPDDPRFGQLQHGNLTLNQEIENIKGNLRAIEGDQGELNGSINSLGRNDQALEANIKELSERINALDRRITELDQARQQDKKEIINKLTAQIATMVQKIEASNASSAASNYSGYGSVHVVKRGQTLSAISQAYGVKMNVLMKVNNLKNPNALREGQELIIPE